MLYERWLAVAGERPSDLALHDLGSGRRWTFGALARQVEAAEAPRGDAVFPVGHTADFVIDVLRGWRAGVAVCPLEPGQGPPSVAGMPADCAHLKTTSATTGAARMIAFTEEQLAADADNIVPTMGLRPDWPNLGVISLAHSYGFSSLITPLLLHGIPLILCPSALPEAVRAGVRNKPALTLPAVPAMWRVWHEGDALGPSIQLAISAGAPLPALLETAVFERNGLKIHSFYGASECGGIAYDSSDTPRADGTMIGPPLRNVSVSVHPGGCLEVRGGAVAKSYWPNPEPLLGGGCFLTSDIAEIEGGNVRLRGRLSAQINVAGRKVPAEVVEAALRGHPAIEECVVFGCPDEGGARSEISVAVVAAKPGTTAQELKAFLLEQLPAWQVPREWWLVDSLKADNRGKTSRAAWRERFLERRARAR